MARKPWPFTPTLRLAAFSLLLAMLSLLVDGWTSTVLTTIAAVLAFFGVIEFVYAWRWRSTYRQ
jgi:hypothetical protein